MPVINKYDADFPQWSKLKKFGVYTVIAGKDVVIRSEYPKTAVFVVKGRAYVSANGTEYVMNTDQAPSNGILVNTGTIQISAKSAPGYWMDRCTVYVFHGDWSDGDIGVFRISRFDKPILLGEPVAYDKNTSFPNHKHPFDQAWLIYKGRGTVCVDGEFSEVEPGDLVLTRSGQMHDFPQAHTYLEGIYLDME